MKSYEIEKMFTKEIIDKKRTGRGVYNRASRRGYTGTVRTHVDFLKGKAKKEYMGNGEVRRMNMYSDLTNLPTVEEMQDMDIEKVKNILTECKKKNTSKSIAEKLGYKSTGSLYHIYERYGVPITKRKYKTKKDKNKDKDENAIDNNIPNQVLVQNVNNEFKNSFELTFKGEYIGDSIETRILSITSSLSKENTYRITLNIEEV